jgi:hypothetical protein
MDGGQSPTDSERNHPHCHRGRARALATGPSLRNGLTTPGSEYVEVVVNVEGCHEDPCQLQLSVFRNVDVATLRKQISDQLGRHLSGRL